MAVPYDFRFGKCTSPTYGSVTLDMISLPRVQANIEVSDKMLSSSSRSVDQTLRIDRFGLKREYPTFALGGWMDMSLWWPVKRLYIAGGPFMLFDHTIPNLLTGDQRLMQNSSWTNAAGTAVTTRLDGATSLAISGVAQMGPTTSPNRTLLTPVTAGAQYFAGCTLRGTGAYSVTISIAWYDLAGSAALSTTSLGAFTSSTGLSSCLMLDGSVSGVRAGGAATAPGGALYAQIRVTTATATVDVSDPVIVPGPADPGNAMTVVQLNEVPEIHGSVTYSGLTLNMSEV